MGKRKIKMAGRVGEAAGSDKLGYASPFRSTDCNSWYRLEGTLGEPVRKLAMTADRGRVVAMGERSVGIWNVDTGRLMHLYEAAEPSLTDLALSPSSNQAATAGRGDPVTIWDLDAGERHGRFLRLDPRGAPRLESVAFTPDGKTVVSGEHNRFRMGPIRLYDLVGDRGGDALFLGAKVDDDPFTHAVAAGPDNDLVVSCGQRGFLRVFSIRTGRGLKEVRTMPKSTPSLSLTSDGRIAALASDTGVVELCDVIALMSVKTFPTSEKNSCATPRFTPGDGKLIARDGSAILVWDWAEDRLLHSLRPGKCPVMAAEPTDDGQLVVSCTTGGMLNAWNLSTGQRDIELTVPGEVSSLALVEKDVAVGLATGAVLVRRLHGLQLGPQILTLSRMYDRQSGKRTRLFSARCRRCGAPIAGPDRVVTAIRGLLEEARKTTWEQWRHMGIMLPPAIQMRMIENAQAVPLTAACPACGGAIRYSPYFGAESWGLKGEPGDIPEWTRNR